MALRERLDVDLKAAMLAKDAAKLSTIRMIKSAVRNEEIDLKRPLEDADMINLLAKLKKQREDSVEQYKTGNRPDLVEKEQAELAVIQGYLPAQLSADEIDKLITDAIAATGAQGAKDMGKVMKALTEQTKGRADGKLVSERVKAKLAG